MPGASSRFAGGPKRHDWDAIDPKLRAMVADGGSRRQIAAELGLPRATVDKRLTDLGLTTAGHSGNRLATGRVRRRKHTAGRWEPSSAMIAARQACADAFGVTVTDLLGTGRTRLVSGARQATAFVLRRRFALSTPRVGAMLGGLCHTTVVHACQHVEWQIVRYPDLAAKVATLIEGRMPQQQDAHVLVWALAVQQQPPPPAIFDDEELADFVDPARAYCGQCDRGVLPGEAARCAARLCGLRPQSRHAA